MKVNDSEFANRLGIDRTTLRKRKADEGWIESLRELTVQKTELIDPHFKKEISLETMDQVRVFYALEGRELNPAESDLWVRLGVDEYSDKLARYFTGISRGMPKERAANLGGLNKKELAQLERAIPLIEDLYYEAVAKFELALLEKIDGAVRKDWKAAAFLLEKHSELREHYKPKEQDGTIEIKVTIERNENTSGVIDMTAKDAEIVESE